MYVVMMTKEGFTKIESFMPPGAGILVLGHGHISHYSEYVFTSSLSIFFTLIAIVFKDYDAAFLYNCCFLFIISVKSLILR